MMLVGSVEPFDELLKGSKELGFRIKVLQTDDFPVFNEILRAAELV